MRACGRSLVLTGLVALNGCRTHAPTTQPTAQPVGPTVLLPVLTKPSMVYRELLPGTPIAPDDSLVAHLDVIEITAPVGAISGDESLWATLQRLPSSGDGQQHLANNGIRLGKGSADQWQQIKAHLDQKTALLAQTRSLAGTNRCEIESGEATTQTLFYYSPAGELQGRSFDASEFFWGTVFALDPTRPGTLDLRLTPTIRTQRRSMQLSLRTNSEYELKYVQPESIYDLGLQVQLAIGEIVILAPTSLAHANSYSIGRRFLLQDALGERRERILIFHPRIYRFSEQETLRQQKSFQAPDRR